MFSSTTDSNLRAKIICGVTPLMSVLNWARNTRGIAMVTFKWLNRQYRHQIRLTFVWSYKNLFFGSSNNTELQRQGPYSLSCYTHGILSCKGWKMSHLLRTYSTIRTVSGMCWCTRPHSRSSAVFEHGTSRLLLNVLKDRYSSTTCAK